MSAEIERRFLVDEATLPLDVRDLRSAAIEQGYLAVGQDGTLVRLRRRPEGGAAKLTVKHGSGLTRAEVEVELSADAAATLWPITEGRRIEKRRALVPLPDGSTAELDRFGGPLSGRTTVEVEFASEERAHAFVPPAWFGRLSGRTDLSWDHPDALNLEQARLDLLALKRGERVAVPRYSFRTGEADGTTMVAATPVIVVEGLYALRDELKDVGDVSAFVSLGRHGQLLRRLFRDVARTGQGPLDILHQFAHDVEPMQRRFIEPTAGNATLVIENEYNPAIEAVRSGLVEVQRKFPGHPKERALRAAGAELLGAVRQVDHFYDPPGRDLRASGEMLRVRDELGSSVLTYKGPRRDDVLGGRPRFEFAVDEDARASLLDLYGAHVRVVEKDRRIYRLRDGTVVTLDTVSKREVGGEHAMVPLGRFTEIRLREPESPGVLSVARMLAPLLATLELDPGAGIARPYAEM